MKIIEEFKHADTSGKNRVFLRVLCDVCDTEFVRQKRLFRTEYCTCSIHCNNIAKGRVVLLECSHCSIKFDRALSKLNNSKSRHYFCTKKCKDIAQTYLEDIRPEHYGSGIHHYRAKALHNLQNVCAICSIADSRVLEVHHKDSDRNNNDLTNLIILCANCHKITHS